MRSFIILLIAVAGMVLASPSYAIFDGGDDNSTNSTAQATGVGVGVAGSDAAANAGVSKSGNSANLNKNKNTAVSGSGVFGSGNSKSTAINGPNTAVTGPSISDASAFSGVDFEDASFGNSRNENTLVGKQSQHQGQSQNQGQVTDTDQKNKQETDLSVDASDRSTTLVQDTRDPVASAAPVFASACSAGVSAQSYGFGGALASTNPMCDLALAVELALKVGNTELANELTERAASFSKNRTNPVRVYGQWIPFFGQLF